MMYKALRRSLDLRGLRSSNSGFVSNLGPIASTFILDANVCLIFLKPHVRDNCEGNVLICNVMSQWITSVTKASIFISVGDSMFQRAMGNRKHPSF